MQSDRARDRGFTIVELIVVIVLVGIVGAVVVPRFLGPSAFEISAAQDALITTLRAAQQAALGRTTDSNAVTFEIQSSTGDWVFVVKSGASTLRSFQVPGDYVVLETGSSLIYGDTCSTGFDAAVAGDFQIEFSRRGDIAAFTNGGVTESAGINGVRICVNDTVALSACVSPAGYAYAGNCDE